MNWLHVIRAWKNPTYRNSLSTRELAQLPPHPAGSIELDEKDIAEVSGGRPKVTENWACSLPTLVCQQQTC